VPPFTWIERGEENTRVTDQRQDAVRRAFSPPTR
jgi:hypothetical protein